MKDIRYYKKVFDEIEKAEPFPVYLLKGTEKYIIEEVVEKIIGRFVPEETASFNLTISYGREVDIEEFVSTALSYPFLSETRVSVLKELENLKGKWKKLVKYCETPVPSTVLVLVYNETDDWQSKNKIPRDFSKLVKVVAKKGKIIEFEKMPMEDTVKWVRSKANGMNVKMHLKAAEALVRTVGDNLLELKNEMDKISLIYEGREVGERELKDVLGSYRVDTMFKFLASIYPGNEGESLRILRRIISSGLERPSSIVYRLIRHFLALLKAKNGALGGYRNRYLEAQAKKFSSHSIRIWLENLRQVDIILKSSSFPEDEILFAAFMHSLKGILMAAPGLRIL